MIGVSIDPCLLDLCSTGLLTDSMAPRRPPNLSIPYSRDSTIQLSDYDTDEDSDSSSLSFSLSLKNHIREDESTSSSSDLPSSDDLQKDLEVLEKLRKSVQKNLRLRPIKSSPSLPKVSPGIPPSIPLSPSWRDLASATLESPASSTGSVYYTPVDIRSPPFSARFIGEPFQQPRRLRSPSPELPSPPPSRTRALEPAALHSLLTAPHRPLLLDTRPAPVYLASHLTPHSINLAIPSLILKRYRKANSGGFGSVDSLRAFITTEAGKKTWDDEVMGPSGHWNGSVVVYDEEMSEKDRESGATAAWAIIPLIAPLLHQGSTIDYLKGGLVAARAHSQLRTLLSSEDTDESDNLLSAPPTPSVLRKSSGSGLFQLNTAAAARSKALPQIEQGNDSGHPDNGHHHLPIETLPHSPLPMMPSAMSSSENIKFDSTPSPPPSHLAFRKPPPPRKPSVSNLRKIDTKSTERLNTNLPKLQIRSPPVKAATLSVPPTLFIATNQNNSSERPPHSPSHLNLIHSNYSPPGSASRWFAPPSPSAGYNGQTEFRVSPFTSRPTTPRTPGTPIPISSPATARPDFEQPPTTEEPLPAFSISSILPNFLYLGPELTSTEHVEELKTLGVKRIINIAFECDDDHGLGLRDTFERYHHIPMRDIVEEENITRGVKEACDILGKYLPTTIGVYDTNAYHRRCTPPLSSYVCPL